MVNECSWMSGICFSFYHSTYCCGDFKRSPPLISLFCQSVPKRRLSKNPASPRGKPRGSCGSWFHSTFCSVPSANGRLRRSGRQIGDPYRERCKIITHAIAVEISMFSLTIRSYPTIIPKTQKQISLRGAGRIRLRVSCVALTREPDTVNTVGGKDAR